MDRASIQERFGIIGSSAAIHNVIDRMRQVAGADITVLVQGESGVGKELVAHALHEMSPRRHGPLIIVNCGAIPEGLIESELFGAEKGAYTGAVERRNGYFEEADNGTIFLDEIGEMPASAQVRLLRVLETGQFTRVGSSNVRKTDTRIIAATNKDLGREVAAGRFREDLYYRLSTVLIQIPPLRDRRGDVMVLFGTFLHRFAQKYNTPVREVSDGAREMLSRYRWPGNVRELRNVAEQCTILLKGTTIMAEDVRPFLRGVTAGNESVDLLPVARTDAGDGTETRERELVYRALVELRIEVRELKEQIKKLVSNTGIAVPREVLNREDVPGQSGDFVIVREADRDDYASLIEDVAYEIEQDERGQTPTVGDGHGRAMLPERSVVSAQRDEAAAQADEGLPTLEEAEHDLIAQALKHFDGNRRQTAKALGISERTLYRKLKEIEEDL